MSTTLAHCLSTMAAALASRRALLVSQWADEHRELSGKQAGERIEDGRRAGYPGSGF